MFQKAIPFIMRSVPLMLTVRMNKVLRDFVKENGKSLERTTSEAGSFEVYSLNINLMNEFTRRLVDMQSIGQGINSMPSMFVVGLVSIYDAFLSQLIRTILITKPEILSSSDKTISFKDLAESKSIEAARDKIIEKEVEAVIRTSHIDQIVWLENKLSIPLRKDLKVWPDFIELCERRNLLTHTAGTVSSQYMRVCKEVGVDISERFVGEQLRVSQKYYMRCVQTVLEFGIKLTQVVWRKLVPDDIELADIELNEFSVRLISKQRYKLAATMLSFGLNEMKKHGGEIIRRRMIVNYANAEKLSGNISEACKILDKEDWSASTDDYKICIAAVKDNVDVVIGMMRKVVANGLVDIREFREWPVFQTVRSHPRFVEAFEREFGEKLLADKETASPQGSRNIAELNDNELVQSS